MSGSESVRSRGGRAQLFSSGPYAGRIWTLIAASNSCHERDSKQNDYRKDICFKSQEENISGALSCVGIRALTASDRSPKATEIETG